jgi:GrpB-like predicted nucleotidyltransferase (UPF0157 family)
VILNRAKNDPMKSAAIIAKKANLPMITIVEHQPPWSAEYAAISTRLRAALGESALRIDHIGSTAVPNLCAKDVIDIQVCVAVLDEGIVKALQQAGFVFRPDITRDHIPPGQSSNPTDWEKRYFNAPAGERRAHIHVRVHRKPNARYPLLFRDYLIARPHMAAAYGELKRRLAASLIDEGAYADVKDPAVDLIYVAAEEWAGRTGWDWNRKSVSEP